MKADPGDAAMMTFDCTEMVRAPCGMPSRGAPPPPPPPHTQHTHTHTHTHSESRQGGGGGRGGVCVCVCVLCTVVLCVRVCVLGWGGGGAGGLQSHAQTNSLSMFARAPFGATPPQVYDVLETRKSSTAMTRWCFPAKQLGHDTLNNFDHQVPEHVGMVEIPAASLGVCGRDGLRVPARGMVGGGSVLVRSHYFATHTWGGFRRACAWPTWLEAGAAKRAPPQRWHGCAGAGLVPEAHPRDAGRV